ncbi:MAG TPA: phosphate butyryltransferase [Clostridia bacterium]|nr:phosphate butyryltransferase [Clostridia bacterium]
MIQSFSELMQRALDGAKRKKRTVAVAAAHDAEVLIAASKATELGLASFILAGDVLRIKEIAAEHGLNISGAELIDEKDPSAACRKAVALVSGGSAHIVMKGLVDTSVMLKAVLDKEIGLRDAHVLSHTAVFDVPGFPRLLYVTDAAMNIAPDAETKKVILENAAKVAHALGSADPVAAAICAVEKVNEKMPATLDAKALVEMHHNGDIVGCRVTGPLALDNAVSVLAAKHKGIMDPLAGNADILLMPDIEAGNILYKALVFLAGAKNAGVIVGAKAPVVITSRADSDETKLYSIALAALMADYNS